MTRPLAVMATLALAVGLPAGAVASKSSHSKSSHRAKVLRATLKPVHADIAAYTAMRGKAQGVLNKRNAKVSLHLKGMVPKTTYTWAVLKDADANCENGTPVTAFKYKRLRSGGKGNANSTAKAKKMAVDRDATYSIAVYQAGQPDYVLLCGQLKGKTKKTSSKGKGKGVTKTPAAKGKGKTKT